jgi:hypothetical protein
MGKWIFALIRTLLFLSFVSICELSFSQGLKVKEFKQSLSDGSAYHAPMDADGHPCGLIKVRTDNSDLEFGGEIVGNVQNKINEYWIYIPQEQASLKIVHPNYLPLVVTFSDYGISISSKATYILTLEETKFKKEKSGLSVIVKPEDAELYLNKVLIDNTGGNGLYQLYLPKGDYICELKKKGYNSYVQMVQSGKASQNINVELESLMAELDVTCKTMTAELYINSQLKGHGAWKGELLPGEYKIEACQKNYVSFSKFITLSDKESRSFVIPELERSKGVMSINTIPSGLPVWIDGDSVGISPCKLSAETGEHYIECQADGLKKYRKNIVVDIEKGNDISIEMQYDDGTVGTASDYQKAYAGDQETILQFICNACHFNNMRYDIAFYWVNRFPNKENVIFHWHEICHNRGDAIWGWWMCNWVQAFESIGKTDKAKQLHTQLEKLRNSSDERLSWYLDMNL